MDQVNEQSKVAGITGKAQDSGWGEVTERRDRGAQGEGGGGGGWSAPPPSGTCCRPGEGEVKCASSTSL